jgi:hypothetical protein
MEISFFIDRDTGDPHVAAHGIQTWEAAEVLQHPEYDYNGREGTRIAVGQTHAGRYLRVIYRRNPLDDSRFVITAYELSQKAKSALRRRRRRRK